MVAHKRVESRPTTRRSRLRGRRRKRACVDVKVGVGKGQWQFKMDGGEWSNYIVDDCKALEDAWGRDEVDAVIKNDFGLYSINFKDMTQTRLSNGAMRMVRRVMEAPSKIEASVLHVYEEESGKDEAKGGDGELWELPVMSVYSSWNIRDKPSLTAKSVGIIESGEVFEVHSVDAQWASVVKLSSPVIRGHCECTHLHVSNCMLLVHTPTRL